MTASARGRRPEGLLLRRFTVWASTTSAPVTVGIRSRMGAFVSGWRIRSTFHFTTAASKGSPLWKVTPLRSRSWKTRSFTHRQLSANPGCSCPASSTRVSPL